MREKNPKLRSNLEKSGTLDFDPELFKTEEQKARYISDIAVTFGPGAEEGWIAVPSNVAAHISTSERVKAFHPVYEDDIKVIAERGNILIYEDRKLEENCFRTSLTLKNHKSANKKESKKTKKK